MGREDIGFGNGHVFDPYLPDDSMGRLVIGTYAVAFFGLAEQFEFYAGGLAQAPALPVLDFL